MLQAAPNLIDAESGSMRGKGYLILDRDTKYTDQFRRLIRGSGTNVIRLPPRSPNLNACASDLFARSSPNAWIGYSSSGRRRCVARWPNTWTIITGNETIKGSATN